MSEKQIPMRPAEVLTLCEPQQPQDSYGTAAPIKPKKSHTGLIIALCITCVVLATALAGIWLAHMRLDFSRGWLRLLPDRPQPVEANEPADQELLPNSAADAATQTKDDTSAGTRLQLGEKLPFSEGKNPQELYAAVSPSVVCVTASGYRGSEIGTGIVLDASGIILTANETVSGATSVTLLFSDDTTATAELIGMDRTTGLALLRCDRDGLTAASLDDSGTAVVGDQLFCIGNPYGTQLRNVLSEGILSASSSVEANGETLTVMKTSASFGSGCYGCPIYNSTGNVIGVTCAVGTQLTQTGEDPDFAVSAADIRRVAEQILSAAGTADSRWLGFEVQEIPQDVYYYYGFPGTLWISRVGEASYADGALSVYDVVLSVDGVSVSTAEEYTAALAAHEAGDVVELRIYRGGLYYRIKLPVTEK